MAALQLYEPRLSWDVIPFPSPDLNVLIGFSISHIAEAEGVQSLLLMCCTLTF